jgi:hypothetical protein
MSLDSGSSGVGPGFGVPAGRLSFGEVSTKPGTTILCTDGEDGASSTPYF